MKLNEIFFEAANGITRRSSETSMFEAIDFIRTNCSEITKIYKKTNNVRIYRGMPGDADFKFGDTSIRSRKSKNTENYYTLIMDNDPIWKAFPKRSESFICSTNPGYAEDYGKLYLVFPVDGTKIGVCPGNDIWEISEDKTNEMLDEFNNFILELARVSRIGLSQIDYNLFKTNLKKIQKIYDKNPESIKKNFDSYLFTNKIKSLLGQNDSNFYKMFLDIISPKDFKLMSTKNFDVQGRHECWFSGNCVFINAGKPIHMGPNSVKTYVKNKKAGNPDTKDLNIHEFIEAL
jgi:hypothetical protein